MSDQFDEKAAEIIECHRRAGDVLAVLAVVFGAALRQADAAAFARGVGEERERNCAAVCDGCKEGLELIGPTTYGNWRHKNKHGGWSPCFASSFRRRARQEEP
jgi:hypothetical protein